MLASGVDGPEVIANTVIDQSSVHVVFKQPQRTAAGRSPNLSAPAEGNVRGRVARKRVVARCFIEAQLGNEKLRTTLGPATRSVVPESTIVFMSAEMVCPPTRTLPPPIVQYRSDTTG